MVLRRTHEFYLLPGNQLEKSSTILEINSDVLHCPNHLSIEGNGNALVDFR